MEDNNELTTELNVQPLDEKTREIAQKIIETEDVDKVKDLTALFNLNSQKRNVMRVMKMNSLLDKVTDQVVERFEKTPHNFSNDDLIKYMQVTENAIERANKNLNLVEETPAIKYQQNNQVNINIGQDIQLDREGRNRVTDAVAAIIKRLNNKDTVDENTVIQEDNS